MLCLPTDTSWGCKAPHGNYAQRLKGVWSLSFVAVEEAGKVSPCPWSRLGSGRELGRAGREAP